MKHLVMLAVMCAWPLCAFTKVRGEVAQALYDLIPGSAQDAQKIFPGYGIKTVKTACDVRCHIRNDDGYICVLPEKNPDNNIYLNSETSAIFYEIVKSLGLTKALGAQGQLTCVAPNPVVLEQSSPSCYITLQ